MKLSAVSGVVKQTRVVMVDDHCTWNNLSSYRSALERRAGD